MSILLFGLGMRNSLPTRETSLHLRLSSADREKAVTFQSLCTPLFSRLKAPFIGRKFALSLFLLGCSILFSCSPYPNEITNGYTGTPSILISSSVMPLSKAGLTGFKERDTMGVYVVNYTETNLPDSLQNEGNQVDHEPYIYSSSDGIWYPASGNRFWKDFSTPTDIYGYFPYDVPPSVYAFPFEVAQNQDSTLNENMKSYEKSDFLWGKASTVTPQATPVNLSFRHLMSKVVIKIDTSKWQDIAGKENTKVFLCGTIREGYIDLSTGRVTPDVLKSPSKIQPLYESQRYEAIVFPQTLSNATPLLLIQIGNKNFYYKTSFTFEQGKQYQFDVTLLSASIHVNVNSIDTWNIDPHKYTVDALWNEKGESLPENETEIENHPIESEVIRRERQTLIDFYQSTSGETWSSSTNWCSSAPISEWQGITVTSEGRVKMINLMNNQLNGPLPESIGRLTEITSLRLANNTLSGTLPDSLCNLKNIETIWFYNNRFTGSIPDSIHRLTKLKTLRLDQNQLSGGLPTHLSTLAKLTSLTLANNLFEGNLPEAFSQLINLTKLTVSNNRLSGTVPSSWLLHPNWENWEPEENILPQQSPYTLNLPSD